MKSSERRLKLMLMIQQKGSRKTVDEFAEYFGVSRRTIFRDFNALGEINVPITWDKYAGYGVMPGFKIPPLMFSTQELATIIVGLNFVKSQVDQQMVEDAKGVEVKIKNVLPEELKNLMNSLQEKTIVDPYQKFGAKKRKGGNWYLLSSAISQKKRVQFVYSSEKAKKQIRKIDPYILVFYEDHWNVIGFSHLRGDVRNFVLDRTSEVEILSENFAIPDKTSIEGLIFRSNASSLDIIIEVRTEALSALEGNLPAKIFKKSEIKPNLFNVCFKFDNLDFINKWLLQFGKEVNVVAPKELIEKRKVLLNEMVGKLEG